MKRPQLSRKRSEAIDLTIVIPAYREALRVGTTLDQLAAYLQAEPWIRSKQVEIIVVSADSTDATHRVVANKKSLFTNFVLVTPGPPVGKGRDVRAGMLRACGAAVLFMDADLATPLSFIEQFYRLYESGSDVVVATRDFRRYRHSAFRIAVSFVGNVLFRIAGGIWIEDSQCGFKLFSKAAAEVCFSHLRVLGWGFDMEILAIARANRFVIRTVHVKQWQAVTGGSFEDNIIRNYARSLADLSLILARRISGSYKR